MCVDARKEDIRKDQEVKLFNLIFKELKTNLSKVCNPHLWETTGVSISLCDMFLVPLSRAVLQLRDCQSSPIESEGITRNQCNTVDRHRQLQEGQEFPRLSTDIICPPLSEVGKQAIGTRGQSEEEFLFLNLV